MKGKERCSGNIRQNSWERHIHLTKINSVEKSTKCQMKVSSFITKALGGLVFIASVKDCSREVKNPLKWVGKIVSERQLL